MTKKFNIVSDYDQHQRKEISSVDFSSAAEEYAAWLDTSSGEYSIAGGWDESVTVTDDQGVEKKFKISGEYNPVYSASEIDFE